MATAQKGPGWGQSKGNLDEVNAFLTKQIEENKKYDSLMHGGKLLYGTAGRVSEPAPATKAGEIGRPARIEEREVAGGPFTDRVKRFESLQAKYPGYVQAGNASKGMQAGSDQPVTYITDPSTIRYDPEFGYIAPANQFGRAGVKGQTWWSKGGWGILAPLGFAAGVAVSGAGAAASAGSGAAAPNAMQAGAMPGVLGSAGSAAEAAIPGTAAFNAAMGGGIGAGLPASTATLGEVGGGLISAAGGTQGGGGLINSAWQWAKDHPMTTVRTASNLLGGGGEQAPSQTMELTDWMAQNKVSPQQFANINLGIRPSGATLVDNSGKPVYDTPPRGIINGRL